MVHLFGECVIALFGCLRSNKYISCYLLTWMVFFVKQILDMLLLCIVYFLLVCLSFFFVSLLLDCRFVVVEAIIFGHLFVSKYIGWGSVLAAHQRYDSRNILRNKLNQSSFSVLFSCVKRFLRCQNVVSRVSFFSVRLFVSFCSVDVFW